MAYALALKCATDLAIGPVILIDTLLYALFTILGIGTILNPILERMGVKRDPTADAAEEMNESFPNTPHTMISAISEYNLQTLKDELWKVLALENSIA